ncbi:NAD(P)/FAD-dependent oxidoreductase [Glutamicibacter arilaitensis]|uniref:NAD(P)/FAD-dependent oxidoreductase n=1 Tax=Glutamicibacter arilaitensis TaxID=256701 RepID=UPI003FD5BF91
MSLERADVAVIGAGIIGAGIASRLSRDGLDVVVIDPAPGRGSSLGNAGLIVPSYSTPMSTPGNLWEGIKTFGSQHAPVTFAKPLGFESLKFLASFAMNCRPGRVKRDTAKLHGLATLSQKRYQQLREDGLDLGMQEQGWLWLSTDEGNAERLHADAQRMRAAGATCDVVNREQIVDLQAGVEDGVASGIWFSNEGFLDPEEAARRWLQDAIDHGAHVVGAKVIDHEATGSNLHTLITDSGKVSARHVVLATGASSRETGKALGISVPVEPGYGWSVTLEDQDRLVSRALMGMEDHVVISPMPGRVRITGGMRFGGMSNAVPADSDISALRQGAEALLPELRHLPELSRWQGARPMTASGVPIIGQRKYENLTVAAGHGPLGVTLAPVTVDKVHEIVEHSLAASRA